VVGGGVAGIAIAALILTQMGVPVPFLSDPDAIVEGPRNAPRRTGRAADRGAIPQPRTFQDDELEEMRFPQPDVPAETPSADPPPAVRSAPLPDRTLFTVADLTDAVTAADAPTRDATAPITPDVYKKLCQLGD